MRAATGLPPCVAGSNCRRCAASTAASSKPWPMAFSTVARVTTPVASMVSTSGTSTVSWIPASRASFGYCAPSFFLTTGRVPDEAGAAGAGVCAHAPAETSADSAAASGTEKRERRGSRIARALN